ncbi:MAG: transcription elongation factor GreA [Chloroflexota bacterium]|jgi:transcription elongation GreA/GreB family factor|nr:transcription elongation factor GreA [Chloroflexota bacterium]
MDMADVSAHDTAATEPHDRTVAPECTVRVRDVDGEHEYAMVTRVTADASPRCLSVGSPVGRALLGRRPGEQVRVHTPGGIRQLTVVDVVVSAPPSGPATART